MLLKTLLFSAFILVHSSENPFADWFMSLKQPDHSQVSCCGPADQFYAEEFKQSDNGNNYIAKVNGQWVNIPENKIDWGRNNPTGRSVIFLMNTEQGFPPMVLCFVPPNSM